MSKDKQSQAGRFGANHLERQDHAPVMVFRQDRPIEGTSPLAPGIIGSEFDLELALESSPLPQSKTCARCQSRPSGFGGLCQVCAKGAARPPGGAPLSDVLNAARRPSLPQTNTTPHVGARRPGFRSSVEVKQATLPTHSLVEELMEEVKQIPSPSRPTPQTNQSPKLPLHAINKQRASTEQAMLLQQPLIQQSLIAEPQPANFAPPLPDHLNPHLSGPLVRRGSSPVQPRSVVPGRLPLTEEGASSEESREDSLTGLPRMLAETVAPVARGGAMRPVPGTHSASSREAPTMLPPPVSSPTQYHQSKFSEHEVPSITQSAEKHVDSLLQDLLHVDDYLDAPDPPPTKRPTWLFPALVGGIGVALAVISAAAYFLM